MSFKILRQGFLLEFIQPGHFLLNRIVLDIEQMLNDETKRVIDELLQVFISFICKLDILGQVLVALNC